MAKLYSILILLSVLLCYNRLYAQTDSALESLQQIPTKYIFVIDKKVDKYSKRITSKTEKTLIKLARWEGKIKLVLEKGNPQIAKNLFGNRQLTFEYMLEKFRSGESIAKQCDAQYDTYKDKLVVNLKYLDSEKVNLNKKILKPLAETKAKVDSLSKQINDNDALQQLIKERKKQLWDATFQIIKKNKYLNKINKETWYYIETMRNYKSTFNDPDKIETTVKNVLNKVPEFNKFVKQNSELASIFGLKGSSSGGYNQQQVISGLQTRYQVQNVVMKSLVKNASVQQAVQQGLQQGKDELNALKSEMIKKGFKGNEFEMPDFKPNMQKTKTFWQRIEYGADIQFAKNSNLIPVTSDISFSVGYKIDDRRIAGIGVNYKLGIGSIDNIKFSNQGVGFRSYLDWKIKKQIFISGGFEINYNSILDNDIKFLNPWQQSALLGVTKKIAAKGKWFKATRLQLLLDLLSKQHTPNSQLILFRVGYNF